MINKKMIVMTMTGTNNSYSFASFCETFGTLVAQTPCYSGVYRTAVGALGRKIVLKGSVAADQLTVVEELKALTGQPRTITIDGVQYANSVIESVKAEFEGDEQLGRLTVIISEVTG